MSQQTITSGETTGPVQGELVDVLVIGGGIVGAGVARDAAMRGLKVLLIEQNDFASGTSSRSSRLLHGGIRYLAQLKVGLVREASREKTILNRIAPHLSEPLPFIFPTRKMTPWSYWKLSIGVKIYDWLCGGKNLGKSQSLNVKKTLYLLPGLEQTDLTGAVRYYDGLTNDARLVVDTLRSAAAHGAQVCNYVRYVGGSREGDIWVCHVERQLPDGSRDTLAIQARSVVNATGPWSHKIENSETSLRLTKGVHLVIDHSRLPVPDAVVVAEGDRILFAIPWGERVILGTTDTDYEGPIAAPNCTQEDQQYVLDAINQAFPDASLTGSDVLSTWAGLRPLVADRRGNPSDISRRHEVTMSHPGWWDVTGGKLTTYRLMGEEVVDQIVGVLEFNAKPCDTENQPLPATANKQEVSGILPPEVAEPVVRYYCEQEWAVHLEDIMVRRTSWRYYHRDHLAIAQEVAQWMSESLGWSEDRMHDELAHYRATTADAAEQSPVPRPHFADLVTQTAQRHIAETSHAAPPS